MAKTLLLLEVNRGDVSDGECGGCRMTKPIGRRAGKRSGVGMWCTAFNEWCAGTFEQPARLEVCQAAEAAVFSE